MNSEIQSSKTRVQTRLPDDLILEEILPRLPVKSLFRFKTVCKDWLYTISRCDFAKSHLRCSSLRTSKQFFILANDSESYNYVFYLLSYQRGVRNNVKDVVLPLHFDNSLRGVVDIVGSCDGLVCLYREFEQHRTFYVWNPATRQCREIDQIIQLEEIEPFMFTAAYGFGYAASDNDYKIVAIFTSYSDDFRSRVYVYSLRLGKWERLRSVLDNYRVSTVGILKGALIDDTLYWPLRFRDHGDQGKHIVGFNLINEQLDLKPWINWLLQKSEANLPLFGIRGSLSLCRYTDDVCFDVWRLKQRDDWNSWEKLFCVDIGYVDFIHFSEAGKCLVQQSKQFKVIDQGQEATQCSQGGSDSGGHYNGHVWEVEDYVESFVSPF